MCTPPRVCTVCVPPLFLPCVSPGERVGGILNVLGLHPIEGSFAVISLRSKEYFFFDNEVK